MAATARLPNEILIEIVKFALAPKWPARLFFPPPLEAAALEGFSRASHACCDIFESLKHEILYVKDLDALVSMNLAYPTAVRYLHIASISDEAPKSPKLNDLLGLTPQLYSLSIPDMETIGLANTSSKRRLATLKMLEVRKGAPRAPSVCASVVTHFPDLCALRLGNEALNDDVNNPFLFHYNLIGFENSLSKLLSHMKNLRVLSLDICLESFDHLGAIRVRHYSNLEHTQASEGYERHYSDCPYCAARYRHNLSVQRENEVTMILAEATETLERVSWVYGWCRSWRDGYGRREVFIQRKDNMIQIHRAKQMP